MRRLSTLIGFLCLLVCSISTPGVEKARAAPQTGPGGKQGKQSPTPTAVPLLRTPPQFVSEVNLHFKAAKQQTLPFTSPLRPFPLRRAYYGLQEGKRGKRLNSLVEEEYRQNLMRRTHYILEGAFPSEDYVFDPLPLPDGEWVLFKFGKADFSLDYFGLFLFNRHTHQLKMVSNDWLANVDVQLSPDGRFISYIRYGGRDGISPYSPDPMELWIYDIKTNKNTKVATGNSLQNTIFWVSPQQASAQVNLKTQNPTSLGGTNSLISYALLQRQRKPSGVGTVESPTTYLFNPVAKRYRTWIQTGRVVRPSPDGHTILFTGPENVEKDFSKITDENFNFALFLRDVATKEQRQLIVSPDLFQQDVILPIVKTFWTPDGRQLLSQAYLYSREKTLPTGEHQAEWALVLVDVANQFNARNPNVENPIGTKPTGSDSIKVLEKFTLISRRYRDDVSFFAFVGYERLSHEPARPKPPSNTQDSPVKSVLTVIKSLSEQSPSAQNSDSNPLRSYILTMTDMTTGKSQQLQKWQGIRGIGALTIDSKPCLTVSY